MKRWLIGGIAAVVVLGVGGPFVYIHFIEGNAPAPLSLSATPSTTPGAPPTNVDGTWKVGAGSQAGYRVGETLFGQFATAVGRTTSVTGSMTIAATDVTAGGFTVDLTTVSSDRSQRDHQFQGRIMDTATFPTATFTLTKPIALGSVPAVGVTVAEQATGQLTLHGTTKPVTFTISARRNTGSIQAVGSIPIAFADWSIPNPSFAGVAETQDHGTLEFSLQLTHA